MADALSCPVCAKPLELAGRTFRCEQCNGAWVTEEAVVAILEARASHLVRLPWEARQDQPRPCASCGVAMQTVNLGSVALDRCAQHGVWFDADELTALLKQAKRFKTNPGHHDEHEEHKDTLLRRLAKLFTVSQAS